MHTPTLFSARADRGACPVYRYIPLRGLYRAGLIGARAYNALRAYGFSRLDELQEYTPWELAGFHGLGQKTVSEVVAVMARHGMTPAREAAQ